MFKRGLWGLLILSLVLLLQGCHHRMDKDDQPSHQVYLKKVDHHDLPGWHDDNLHTAVVPLKKSCQKILKEPGGKKLFTLGNIEKKAEEWHPFCKAVLRKKDPQQIKTLIKEYLHPYKVCTPAEEHGLFTGYFEPELRGSYKRSGPYQTPLYKLPPASLRSKFDRQAIAKGALRGKNLELLWVDSPIDAFFLEVQGSGRVRLPSGEIVRVGYAGQNGHAYFAIGKALIDRGHLTAKQVSMQSIKAWLKQHPHQAQEIMNLNSSYVFFKIRGHLDHEHKDNPHHGPIGSAGIPLTQERSLAIDPKFIPLNNLLWIDADHPVGSANIQKMLISQDTGGAIKGPIRGDLFWGHGHHAERHAGKMKSKGSLYIFLPKSIHG